MCDYGVTGDPCEHHISFVGGARKIGSLPPTPFTPLRVVHWGEGGGLDRVRSCQGEGVSKGSGSYREE
jgi:hypothetical protein